MAEGAAGAGPGEVPGRPGGRAGVLWQGLRAYGLVVAMWVRSTMAYRASFAMVVLVNLLVSGLEFVGISIMFSHVDVLGGFGFAEVAFLYGTATTAFGIADLLLGSLQRIGARVRDGTVDTLLVRPAPVLAQAAADRFALRRVGRVVQGLGVLLWSLTRLEVDWTPGLAVLVVVTVVAGSLIFGALLVAGAAFQFWAQDASEVQNAFTYGGNTLLQYPPTLFAQELVRGVTFVVPLAFVNWLPALRVLGRDDPLGLPGWADFLSPAVALVCCAAAGWVWRAALRGHRSTGS
ncbi:ABC transporter permease [Streptomyces glaucosporus]|uniref:ABC transporter permease n=2 Tax=Streptomyces glaucosporus TaxID=284044 RepID=A0ABP5V8X4_9ACTN